MAIKELIRSKDESRILTGNISGIEDEYYKMKNQNISCAIVWYKDIKVLIPSTHLGIEKVNKSIIRGMLGAEIDFIVIEIDTISNIAIASRIDAMKIRQEVEMPKLRKNDIARVRILAVGKKHILVDLYGKESIIRAENLRHTFIFNCKDIYKPGEYLKVRIINIDIEKDILELDAKCFIDNPYENIRKYIVENGEYTGKVIAFPKQNSGIVVQLDTTDITCMIRVPAKFNNYPHFLDNVLIKVTEIHEKSKKVYGYLMRVI